MDKEVLIHVSGLQTMDADGDQEPIEIVAWRVLFQKRQPLSAV